MAAASTPGQTRALLWQSGGWIIALFWFIQFVELTLVGVVEGGALATRLLAPRALNVLAGVLLTTPIIEVAARTGGQPFRRRLALTVATALAMCVLLMGANYVIFYMIFFGGRITFDATEFIYTAFGWSWFFLGVAGAVVGLAYSVEVRDRERRLAAMEIIAKDARLAALRYQLNPHFLFNTLNSIASLIAGGDHAEAETMVETLSDFLRATLELDPVDDIPLARELDLQALYLSIEQVRFPSRLQTIYDVSEKARAVPVPALITQPIVENAIRHAVARSRAPVTISISGAVVADMLRLTFEDDGPPPSGRRTLGTNVGIGNVRERLESRYGDRQSLRTEQLATGYRVTVELPLGGL